MFNIIYNTIIFIITLCVLIIVHEYGHFYIARCFNLCIACFSLGFGPKILEFNDKYGTKYIMRLFLLGGYVKIPENNDDYNKKNIYKYKLLFYDNLSLFKRMLIILGGPIANILLAFIIYWFIFFIGYSTNKPIIHDIEYASIADTAGILPNTEIKKINNKDIVDWNSINLELNNNIINKKNVELDMQYINSKKIFHKTLKIDNKILSNNQHNNLIYKLGIIPEGIDIIPIIIKIQKKSAASQANLHVGDQILQIQKYKINNWYNFKKIISYYFNRKVIFFIKRNNKIIAINISIPNKKTALLQNNYIGIKPKIIDTQNINTNKIIYKCNLLQSLWYALNTSYLTIKIILHSLLNLFTHHNININNFRGPIYIANVVSSLFKENFKFYLYFLALISINLAIINLLPLPILDGGQLCIIVIEKIIRRKIPTYIKMIIYNLSMLLLILIMGLSFVNDYAKL
ncbi:RIP metalloprotease RseP [Enterobacteriaceae endosymbiont of Neohaemonia nigricornis]|uniref:RIP metalloprotease RseP n=1 Tax=Enterobacteriaceae endosymbiont of Neohaemonia nigricornis TaxID=2675792 RepID=UPI001ABF63AE|nr:RIP metalloprotease RseP [Enterobacteriaceae endosymbiont of Neohaemonia nigricornis]